MSELTNWQRIQAMSREEYQKVICYDGEDYEQLSAMTAEEFGEKHYTKLHCSQCRFRGLSACKTAGCKAGVTGWLNDKPSTIKRG